jgi:UDP-N-acetylmuramoyl-L-alanyl-D-glutamate--2,6-diaminopimelate ligase
MVPHRLNDLCRIVADHSTGRVVGEIHGDPEVEVTGIADNSSQVSAGDLFVCISGTQHDGHDFASAALSSGALALLVERLLPLECPQILVSDTRLCVGEFAAALYGHPGDSLLLVGVTGTNGKTTTAQLIAAILGAAGHRVRTLGTLSQAMTTPEAIVLQSQFATWRNEGCDAVVMEVSSHALALHRVNGLRFSLAVFTNLGRDHLDLHLSMEAYFRAKARLFTPELSDQAVINTTDLYGALLVDSSDIPVRAIDQDRLREVRVQAGEITGWWADTEIKVPLGGHTNVANVAAALEVADLLGISPEVASQGLREMSPIPGRFEVVRLDESQRISAPTVIVDFAHTPEGLEELLSSARALDGCEQIVLVFGCGGDRDREKRPRMGGVAVAGADRVVVTSDNPRTEDPALICAEVISGIDEEGISRVVIELDRRNAIATAVKMAGPMDVVLIAGKGHERTQCIGNEVLAFSDAEVVRDVLRNSQEADS